MQLFDLRQGGGPRACQCQFWGLEKLAPYLDSLKPLGLRCCFVCDVVGWGRMGLVNGMHFSQTKNAVLLKYM